MAEREKTGISSSSYEGANLVRLGPCCLNSFNLCHLFSGPVSKSSHTGSWGFHVWILWGWETWTLTITMTESSCLQDIPYRHHKIRRKLGPVFFKHGSLGTTDFSFKHPSRKGCASLVGGKIQAPGGHSTQGLPLQSTQLIHIKQIPHLANGYFKGCAPNTRMHVEKMASHWLG